MNVLRITQSKTWFVVELGDSRLHMLNQKSLVFFLKNKIGFDKTAIASVIHMFEYQQVVEINLNSTAVAS